MVGTLCVLSATTILQVSYSIVLPSIIIFYVVRARLVPSRSITVLFSTTTNIIVHTVFTLRPFLSIYFWPILGRFWADSPNVHLNLWRETINNKLAQQIPWNGAGLGLFVSPIYPIVGRFLVRPLPSNLVSIDRT